MNLEDKVLAALRDKPLSGGKLIEMLQAREDKDVAGRAVVVYGALANLRAAGKVEVAAEGQGERVFRATGSTRDAPSAAPGFPPSFSLGEPELALIEKAVWRMTKGLPPHYFEELRRVVVADADRRAFHGAKVPGVTGAALAALGPETGIRRYLKRAERGGRMPLAIGGPRLRRLVVPLVIVAVLVLLRLFVFGVYTLPHDSESMAPALMPGREGGDDLVVVNLLAPVFGDPERWEPWVFELGDRLFVKRVAGLPGEEVALVAGNLEVNGRIVVKERETLDAVKVPLFRLDDFVRTEAGRRVQVAYNAHSFRNPDGSLNPSAFARRICREVVVRARVRATADGASVTFQLDNGWRGQGHVVVLGRTGLAVVAGQDVARGPPLQLEPGTTREVWLTNADGVFRVEIDGREAVRTPLRDADKHARLTVVAENAEIEELELARDLHYEGSERRRLGDGEYFVLGDNSANSRDSRQLGPIRGDAFVGRVLCVAWPPSRIRVVR
jgi:signal peptidase I